MLRLKKEELEAMASLDVRTVDIDSLTDLRNIKIDASLPVERKIELLSEQTDNLYMYRIGDFAVKVSFQKEGASMEEKLEEYLKYLAEVCL